MVKFYKNLPHVFIQVMYKITYFDSKKNHQFVFFAKCNRDATFEWFDGKGLSPLEVNPMMTKAYCSTTNLKLICLMFILPIYVNK